MTSTQETGTTAAARCECGAAAGPLGVCVDAFHAILAEEHTDARMARWHTPVVCAYMLQHPERASARHLDRQYRMLQFYLDRGLDALSRLARRQVARNRHTVQTGSDPAPLAPYAPLPDGGPPARFGETFAGLPHDGRSFIVDGHEAYGRRIERIAAATVEAWRSLGG